MLLGVVVEVLVEVLVLAVLRVSWFLCCLVGGHSSKSTSVSKRMLLFFVHFLEEGQNKSPLRSCLFGGVPVCLTQVCFMFL